MGESEIELKAINGLLEYNFFIPSYQRGYRWDEIQVVDLLDDIFEFIHSKKAETEFYCLQPVIVKEDEDNKYILIDGQQRLTTVYIILSYLNKQKFSIEFETRKESGKFLENISEEMNANINYDNIDFYHMSQARGYITKWFDKKVKEEATIREEFFINLGKYTKVIWYEIGKSGNEIEVFTRINSGKIPLTNAELIKALFLNSRNFTSQEKNLKQIEIAKEWDEIEYALQNDEFWYFLTKEEKYSRENYPTRIELLFEIFFGKELSEKDEFATYRSFAEKRKDITKLWSEEPENIKKVFYSLKYWFDDHKLYHLIGYLISIGSNIKGIYNKSKGKKKSEFKKYLLDEIKKGIKIEGIDELNYNDSRGDVLKILLLFNIETILNNKDSYIRFAFDKFNKEKWSIEHIHAQQDKEFQSNDAIKDWLSENRHEIEIIDISKGTEKKEEIIGKIDGLINTENINSDNDEFLKIKNEIFEFFGESDIHSIDNLALLPKEVNSSLNNNVFPVKRKILIEKDKNGAFIPICTKNVFLKYYSKNVQHLSFWSPTDRKYYADEIKSVIRRFKDV